jgi:hypothetical protein
MMPFFMRNKKEGERSALPRKLGLSPQVRDIPSYTAKELGNLLFLHTLLQHNDPIFHVLPSPLE